MTLNEKGTPNGGAFCRDESAYLRMTIQISLAWIKKAAVQQTIAMTASHRSAKGSVIAPKSSPRKKLITSTHSATAIV